MGQHWKIDLVSSLKTLVFILQLLFSSVINEPEDGLIDHVVGVSFKQCVEACNSRQLCCSSRFTRLSNLCVLYSLQRTEGSKFGVHMYSKSSCPQNVEQCESGSCTLNGDSYSCSKPVTNAGFELLGNMVSIGSKIKYACLDNSNQGISECLLNGKWSVTYIHVQCNCSEPEPIDYQTLTDIRYWTYSKLNDTIVSADAVCANQCTNANTSGLALCNAKTGEWTLPASICCTSNVCPDWSWTNYLGSCYKIIPGCQFVICAEECENEGGHIVYIETSAENEWLKGDFLPRYSRFRFYIGVKKASHAFNGGIDDHVWVNYKLKTSIDFRDFLANDFTSDSEECVFMQGLSFYQWADIGCSRFLSAVCETEIS